MGQVPPSPEERLAVIEDWRQRTVDPTLEKLVTGQQELGTKFDLIHRTVDRVDRRLAQFPQNGDLAGLVKLGKYADRLTEAMDRQSPESQRLNTYVLEHMDQVARFVEMSGDLIDLIERKKDKIIFFALLRRWSGWDRGLRSALQWGLGLVVTALATAYIFTAFAGRAPSHWPFP